MRPFPCIEQKDSMPGRTQKL